MGWPGCHVIAKLIFVAFNKHAEIPANANQPGSCNQALTATRCMTLDSFVDQICDFEQTSLIEKILYIPSDYVYSEYI